MHRIIPFLLIMMFSAACTGGSGDNVPVPKPVAYPRIDTLPQEYTSAGGLNVNRGAEIVTDSLFADGTRWITVDYPTYQASLYISEVPVAKGGMEVAVENRTERMALNSGGNTGELISFMAKGYDIRILVTPRHSSHPVQLLAVNPAANRIITATAVLNNPGAIHNPDSVAPVIDALKADITSLLKDD